MTTAITTENGARMAGYTKGFIAESLHHSVHILVQPDTDLDDSFKAYDADNCEMIRINGWNWSFERCE